MSFVYAFAATKAEAEPVTRLIVPSSKPSSPGVTTGRAGPNQVAVFVTGMGPKRARSAALTTFQRREASWQRNFPAGEPDAAIVMGLCGGLTASFSEGMLVSYTECRSTEAGRPPLSCSASLAERQISVLKSNGIRCELVAGITSDRIASAKSARIALAATGAHVVDMETYEILAVAREANVPVTVFRVVSDTLGQEMPDFNGALKSDGDFDGWKALEIALGSPMLTLRLIAGNRRAMGKLAPALRAVLGADCFTEAPAKRPGPSSVSIPHF